MDEHNKISGIIVDRAMKVHTALGPGLLESVSQRILDYELRKAGLSVETEVPIPVEWDGNQIDVSFRADLVVEGLVLVELQSSRGDLGRPQETDLHLHEARQSPPGLLINFGAPMLKDGIHRIVNQLPE